MRSCIDKTKTVITVNLLIYVDLSFYLFNTRNRSIYFSVVH